MEITTFKNIAFASFTFLPVIVLAVGIVGLLYPYSRIAGNQVNFRKIIQVGLMAALYQLIFLLGFVSLFGLLMLANQVQFIPLIVLLPLSTFFSFVIFIKLYWSARNEIHT